MTTSEQRLTTRSPSQPEAIQRLLTEARRQGVSMEDLAASALRESDMSIGAFQAFMLCECGCARWEHDGSSGNEDGACWTCFHNLDIEGPTCPEFRLTGRVQPKEER